MVGSKQVASKRYKIEVHGFHMPQKVIPQLHFSLNGSPIDYVTEFIFLGLMLDCNLKFKSHLKTISRVIGLLHKLKYIFPTYLLRMIYNSLILPHINHCLLAWGSNCHRVELLQKKAARVVNFKSPVAHTVPILKKYESTEITRFVYFPFTEIILQIIQKQATTVFCKFYTTIWCISSKFTK